MWATPIIDTPKGCETGLETFIRELFILEEINKIKWGDTSKVQPCNDEVEDYIYNLLSLLLMEDLLMEDFDFIQRIFSEEISMISVVEIEVWVTGRKEIFENKIQAHVDVQTIFHLTRCPPTTCLIM